MIVYIFLKQHWISQIASWVLIIPYSDVKEYSNLKYVYTKTNFIPLVQLSL